MMGPTEVPAQSPETTIKIPTAHYEFGANYYDPKVTFLVISCFNIFIVMKNM
jgi:mitochondrial import receptor subunit TOM40